MIRLIFNEKHHLLKLCSSIVPVISVVIKEVSRSSNSFIACSLNLSKLEDVVPPSQSPRTHEGIAMLYIRLSRPRLGHPDYLTLSCVTGGGTRAGYESADKAEIAWEAAA
jgi:hypothetical protein